MPEGAYWARDLVRAESSVQRASVRRHDTLVVGVYDVYEVCHIVSIVTTPWNQWLSGSRRDGRALQIKGGTNGFPMDVSPLERDDTRLGSIYRRRGYASKTYVSMLLVYACIPSDDSPGPFNDLNPAPPGIPASPLSPMFGENRNVPFIFQSPPPQSNAPYPWAPPRNFSPQKAFPQPELRDVDMSDLSPPKTEESEKENGRAVATGGLRRVYKLRQKARTQSHSRTDEEPEQASEDDSEDEKVAGPLTQNTSNHYTLNMPSVPAPQSDTPYVLLG